MAGDMNVGTLTYNDIDSSKVLNKEGLLRLSSEIKSYVNSSGATYTFTNGLTSTSGTVSWNLNDRIQGGTASGSVILGDPDGVGYNIGQNSCSEGLRTLAYGNSSHAEGFQSKAYGNYSHAEGESTTASGYASHAEGQGTIAKTDASHAQGKYNISDNNSVFAHIVGNGTSTTRSNAMALGWNGNQYLSGNVYVGCSDYSTTSGGLSTTACGGSKLATEAYVNSAISSATASGGGGASYSAGDGISISNSVISVSEFDNETNGRTIFWPLYDNVRDNSIVLQGYQDDNGEESQDGKTVIYPAEISMERAEDGDVQLDIQPETITMSDSYGTTEITPGGTRCEDNYDTDTKTVISPNGIEISNSAGTMSITNTDISFWDGLYISCNEGTAEINGIPVPVAEIPENDGTYTLQLTVDSGSYSFEWVEVQ